MAASMISATSSTLRSDSCIRPCALAELAWDMLLMTLDNACDDNNNSNARSAAIMLVMIIIIIIIIITQGAQR
jgi:hypothetical protein